MELQLTLDAILTKVQTTSDGGIRVTFDLPLSESENAAQLMHYLHKRLAIGVVCGPQAR